MTDNQRRWFAILILCLVALGFAMLSPFAHAEMVLASIDDGHPTRFDGEHFRHRIATGERFDPNKLAVAHKTLPLHSCITISYRSRTQLATVNDRGPCLTPWCQQHAPARIKRRELDMTPELARLLRFPGTGRVSFHPVECRKS